MSLLCAALVVEKYGERLNAAQLAAFFGVSANTLYNEISAGTCPIKTHLDGKKQGRGGAPRRVLRARRPAACSGLT